MLKHNTWTREASFLFIMETFASSTTLQRGHMQIQHLLQVHSVLTKNLWSNSYVRVNDAISEYINSWERHSKD